MTSKSAIRVVLALVIPQLAFKRERIFRTTAREEPWYAACPVPIPAVLAAPWGPLSASSLHLDTAGYTVVAN